MKHIYEEKFDLEGYIRGDRFDMVPHPKIKLTIRYKSAKKETVAYLYSTSKTVRVLVYDGSPSLELLKDVIRDIYSQI